MGTIENQVVEDTLQRIKDLYGQEGLKAGILKKLGIRPGWNVIIGTEGQCGMAVNFTGVHGVHGPTEFRPEEFKPFIGKDLIEVAEQCLASARIPLRAIGLAALGGLSQPLLQPERLRGRGHQVLEGLSRLTDLIRPDDVVTVVGFGGLVRNLVGKCKEVHATDMRPVMGFQTTIIGEAIEFGPKGIFIHSDKENEEVIKGSDVVIITASSLVNGTFPDLMRYAASARLIGLYGPSGSLIPDSFFERGVGFIMSHAIQDPVLFEHAMIHDTDMEGHLRTAQRHQMILKGRP